MQLTIVPDDGVVIKDGKAKFEIDLSFIPENISAMHWFDTDRGAIEYRSNGKISQNKEILEIHPLMSRALALFEAAN